MGQEGILLCFVEPVDFIHEQHRVLAEILHGFSLCYRRPDVLHAGQHRGQADPPGV
jgi:hypothetical protein